MPRLFKPPMERCSHNNIDLNVKPEKSPLNSRSTPGIDTKSRLGKSCAVLFRKLGDIGLEIVNVTWQGVR